MPPACKKVWALWPPTAMNLEIFYPHWAERQRNAGRSGIQHEAVGLELRECKIVLTREHESLYLPPGWIYSVLTLRGPGLIGQSLILASSLPTVIDCLNIELSQSFVCTGDVLGTFTMFVEAFHKACGRNLNKATENGRPDSTPLWNDYAVRNPEVVINLKLLQAVNKLKVECFPPSLKGLLSTLRRAIDGLGKDTWCPCGCELPQGVTLSQHLSELSEGETRLQDGLSNSSEEPLITHYPLYQSFVMRDYGRSARATREEMGAGWKGHRRDQAYK